MYTTLPPVFIWPDTQRKFYELEDYFYGIYPDKPLRAWNNDELAAWVFGYWVSQSAVKSGGMSKILLSELWFRAAAIEAALGLTPPPEVEIYHDDDEDEDYEYIDEVDEETLEQRVLYLAHRPQDHQGGSFFSPAIIHDNILRHLKDRILLAEAVFTTGRDSRPERDEPRSWSDQLLIDVMVMIQIEFNAENRRFINRLNNAAADPTNYKEYSQQVLEVLVSRGGEQQAFIPDLEFTRDLMSERENLQEDLLVLANALLLTPTDSELNGTLFDRGVGDDFGVSLHEFVSIMTRAQLPEGKHQRLQRVQQLSELTYPHVPDLAAFSLLFALVTQKYDLEYVDHEQSVTQRAVESLFLTQPEQRLSALADPCVLVRTAVALGGYSDELNSQIDKDDFTCVHFAYWGLPFEALVENYERALKASFENNESLIALPPVPSRYSTECRCVPGYEALSNFLTSRGMFAPKPAEHISSAILGKANGYWSSLSDKEENAGNSLTSHDGFTFTVKQAKTPGSPEEYVLNFAQGGVFISFVMQQDYPTDGSKEWIELWDERTDMIQYVMEATAHKEKITPTPEDASPRRKLIWTYLDVPEEDHDPLLSNQVLVFDPTTGNYSQNRFEKFVDGFYFVKKHLNNG